MELPRRSMIHQNIYEVPFGNNVYSNRLSVDENDANLKVLQDLTQSRIASNLGLLPFKS